jgi:hypothetical protein
MRGHPVASALRRAFLALPTQQDSMGQGSNHRDNRHGCDKATRLPLCGRVFLAVLCVLLPVADPSHTRNDADDHGEHADAQDHR